MCVLCGCSTCTGDGALDSFSNGFNLSVVPTTQSGTANYKWNNDTRGAESGIITWSLDLTGLSMIAGSNLQEFVDAVEDSFDAWAAIAGVTFQFNPNFGSADIDIDVAPLTFSTIGIANMSIFNSDADGNGVVEIATADISMDQRETWRPDGDGGAFTFLQVMMHEIGHALGLDHFNVSDSIMNATANNGSRLLGDDDIAGIQDLYGARRWSDAGENVDFKLIGVGQTAYALGGDDDLNGTGLGDTFYGGFGNDELFGEGGDDFLMDTRGSNELFGGEGNDGIIGGSGTLFAEGNAGDDIIVGGIGNDTLNGGAGDDIIIGDPSGSFISGDDRLIAGEGDDWLEGGGGADVFVFSREDGDNRIGEISLSGNSFSMIGGDFEVGVDLIDLVDFNVGQGDLDIVGNDTVFTYDLNGVDFTLTIQDAILTSADFI